MTKLRHSMPQLCNTLGLLLILPIFSNFKDTISHNCDFVVLFFHTLTNSAELPFYYRSIEKVKQKYDFLTKYIT